MPNLDQYTIAFLKKKYSYLKKLLLNNNNHYMLEEIKGYQVIITILPDKEYRILLAAGVARNIIYSFPNIYFRLMVGIGSRVPIKHDICLGNIMFYQAGFLNQLLPILCTAVTGLQAYQFIYLNSKASCSKFYNNNPVIHYSFIASRNRVVKNTTFYNKLAAEQDILYFKIEVAGLMNYFPCLVIYSIYNYTNLYKSKKWQG
ncbi:hypothetical protein BJX76DRAFT_351820 [Aspergillus varians]